MPLSYVSDNIQEGDFFTAETIVRQRMIDSRMTGHCHSSVLALNLKYYMSMQPAHCLHTAV